MRKLFLTLLAVAFIALPAYASVQNIKVSGDIDSTYLFRRNFDFGLSTKGDEYQSLFLTQTRLRVDSDLTDNVAATVALINERVWGRTIATSEQTTEQGIDINLAYVTLKEMLYSPLTVVIGRQNFRYGNSLIIDSMGLNNQAPASSGLNNIAEDLSKASAFDSIRAILDYNPLKIELAFVELDPGRTLLGTSELDQELYGGNATYEFGDPMKSLVEGYVWYRVDKHAQEGAAGEKADTIKVVGTRGSINPIERLNLQAEVAWQGGNKVVDTNIYKPREAWITQGIANYQIPVLDKYKPVAGYVFTMATGDVSDADDATGHYTAWDPMFENQAGGKIYNALFPLSNVVAHEVNLSAVPVEDLTAAVSLTGLWLQRKYPGDDLIGLLQPDGLGIGASSLDTKKENTFLGKELDLVLTYDYTEDVQLGANIGWYFPGSVFTQLGSKNSDTAKQLLLNCLVKF